MKILKAILLFIFSTYNLSSMATFQASLDTSSNISCYKPNREFELKSSWLLWEPYAYTKVVAGDLILTGMDIELSRIIAKKLGSNITYTQSTWLQSLLGIREGDLDFIAGASYSLLRSSYAYYSIPYRYEENSLFILRKSNWNLNFNNIQEFIAQIRLQKFKLGVTKGFIYGNDLINDYINDESNSNVVSKFEDNKNAVEALLKGEIDGLIADRVSGAAHLLKDRSVNKVDEISLGIKIPIYLIFSKKTISQNLVEDFNNEIKKFIISDEYKEIVAQYLYPVLLLHTCHSEWFYLFGIIGSISFAFSSLAIGFRENTTLFGSILLAVIPAIGGSIMRDVMIAPSSLEIVLTPSYLYYAFTIVIIGFATIRLLNYYNSGSENDVLAQKFWDNVLIICDALGQSVFIVTGVVIVIMAKIQPLELWGPFFAFLTAHGGIIIRDLIRNERINFVSTDLRGEITILWGLLFSIFLSMDSYSPNPDKIKIAVMTVTIGAFLTRILVHYYKIPNLRYKQFPKSIITTHSNIFSNNNKKLN